MNLKIAELRRKHHLTQKELGDILSVSYQTVSKWENGQVLPDISILPMISRYFHVSVDAILGLTPLEEEYIPCAAGTSGHWSGKLSYLKESRRSLWNEDYFAFLVDSVWGITEPVEILDCGCGYGALGLLLLPLLPKGSHYVGVDFSKEMIEDAIHIFSETEYDADFICEDVLNLKIVKQYDIVAASAVLRHVNDGFEYLRKMAELTKENGLLISMECNREFEASGLHIEGMEYVRLCEHEGLKKLWSRELEKQNRDYAIAMKIPHYMKTLGFTDIGCRMNDRVNLLEKEDENHEEKLESIIRTDHWACEKSDIEMEKTIEYFMNHGMSRLEAERYCRQQNDIARYLKQHKESIALTKATGLMISYGWKRQAV